MDNVVVKMNAEDIQRYVQEKGLHSPFLPLQMVHISDLKDSVEDKYTSPQNTGIAMNQNDVRIFMEAGDQIVSTTPGFTPENIRAAELYMKLIAEEYMELDQAFAEEDIVGVADGCGDLIWVVLGLCNALGINMAAVWSEINSSNASKTVDGKLIKREDGKILKPDTYFPPNIRKALSLGDE